MLYGGVKYEKIRHAVFCKKCKEIVESISPHDFRMCSCNSVGVEGGISDGNRILGNPSDIEDRSIYMATIGKKKIFLPFLNIDFFK
jgi:hypothetical protein